MMDANLESLQNLRDNLAEYGLSPDTLPYVIQCNKRDLPGVMSIEEMDNQLNKDRVPIFGASALQGKGVLPTLTTICKMVLRKMQSSQGLGDDSARAARQKAATYKATRQGKKPEAPRPPAESAAQAKTSSPSTSRPAPPAAPPKAQPEEAHRQPVQPKRPELKVDPAGMPKALSDTELAVPVELTTGEGSRRAVLRVRLGLEQGRTSAEVVVQEKTNE